MSTPSKLTIIFAGEDFTVTLLDGTAVPVRVRAMPVRHLGHVLTLADKEADLLDFVCCTPCNPEPVEGQSQIPDPKTQTPVSPALELPGWTRVPPGWSDNLTESSHDLLYEAAKRLNFSRAANWAERQIVAKKFSGELALKADEVIMPVIERIVALLTSSQKLPESREKVLPKS